MNKIKNSQLNTILSWLNHICFNDIEKTFKECNEIEKLIFNVERDLSLRVKFSHIDFNKLFEDVENKDKDLFYSTMKIYNKMIKVII